MKKLVKFCLNIFHCIKNLFLLNLKFSDVILDNIFKIFKKFLGNACTIVLRGSTQQILDEAERSLHDALCVLTTHIKNAKTVPGAGAAEMLMSNAVINEAQKVKMFENNF